MPNPLLDGTNQGNQGGASLLGVVSQLRNGNPQAIYNQMYQSNPQFRDFANSMKGKSPEQAFREKGFDYNKFKGLF